MKIVSVINLKGGCAKTTTAVATGGTENTAAQVTALIMAGASVVAYIIGEGLTDSANAGIEVGVEIEDAEKEV